MKRNFVLPLHWQLTLWYLGLLTLLLVALGVFLTVSLDRFLVGDTRSILQAQVRPADDAVRSALASNTFAEAAPEVARAASAPGVGVLVATPDGSVLTAANGPRNQPIFDRALLPPPAAGRGAPRDGFGIVSSDGTRYAVLMHRLVNGSSDVGALQLSADLSRADETVHQFQLLYAAGGLAALILAGLAGGLITGRGLKPLQKVAAMCRAMAAGDLSQRLRLPFRHDEIGTVAVAFDEMAERLEANFSAQRQFVADAAHELRTPLAAISGYTDLLLRGAHDDPPAANQMLRTMLNEEDRMGRLVDDLLALARLEASPPNKQERVDVATMAAALAQQTQLLAPHLKVNYEGLPSAMTCAAPDELRQALLNLADNAHKYTPDGGSILFRVANSDGGTAISVSNSGPAIPAEALPHLFDRFYRADVSRTRRTGGAGLGLAITRALVERQGGAISAASNEGGNTFTLSLPSC